MDIGDQGFFASPIVVTLGGTRQIISATQKHVIGVSVADGKLLWRYPWDGSSGGTTPVLAGDTIIVSGLNAGVAAFRPAKRDGQWQADAVWETKEVSMYVSNPVVIGDTLFGLSRRANGQFFGVDTRSGKVLWLGQPREAANTAVVKADDLLFLLNDDAELIVARSSRTGFEPLKRYTVADSATWAQPAISRATGSSSKTCHPLRCGRWTSGRCSPSVAGIFRSLWKTALDRYPQKTQNKML